jgi:hypothetical protein
VAEIERAAEEGEGEQKRTPPDFQDREPDWALACRKEILREPDEHSLGVHLLLGRQSRKSSPSSPLRKYQGFLLEFEREPAIGR